MATTYRNHYQVLMLDPTADGDLLTTVYRRLVQRDQLSVGADGVSQGRLQAVEQAYAVLRDPSRRARYDAELSEGGPRDRAIEHPARPAEVAARHAPGPAPTSPGPGADGETHRAPTAPSSDVIVLDFGRYAGWSLRQIAARDPDYLEWLRRAPGGRQYRAAITKLVGRP